MSFTGNKIPASASICRKFAAIKELIHRIDFFGDAYRHFDHCVNSVKIPHSESWILNSLLLSFAALAFHNNQCYKGLA